MNFIRVKDVSGQGGQTSIGKCIIPGISKAVDCVEKILSPEDYDNFVRVNESFATVLKRYGPHVCHTDAEKKKVYMEFLNCITVEEYCIQLDATADEDLGKAKRLFESIEECLEFMAAENVCHNDLHTANILACEDGSVKIVDIETMTTAVGTRCYDEEQLYGGLHMAFFANPGLRRAYKREKQGLVERYTRIEDAHIDATNAMLEKTAPQKRHGALLMSERRKKGRRFPFV
ncbi:unnamed protein product [Ectocarpus sp. 12 AP-2014]